jgi:DNA-binding IclR family transcriptional regulator
MVRPALSASRGFDIIDLLAASPDQGFTLSEIARAVGINVASCHAVLAVLAERGYLLRDPQSRKFSLGPMLFAAGQAALFHQPLLEQARAAAKRIVRELDIPIAISTVIGEDIVGIVAIPDSGGGSTGLRVGERRPLIPPIGTPFVAWSGDEVIAQWLGRAPEGDAEWREDLLGAIATIRERGFEVLLRTSKSTSLASELNALAGNGYHRLGPDMSLPETIDAEGRYDVMMIAAPIFDRSGACVFNMCLGPFPHILTGTEVLDHADRLLRACLAVMHADRA